MTDEVRTISSTGGRKGQKLERPDLIPAKALRELATHYGIGAAKYTEVDDEGNVTHDGANNWRLGYEWSKSSAGLLRHVLAFLSGEDIDEETGSKHVIAAAWHCLTLATFMDEYPTFDDRWDSPASRLARNPEIAARLGLIAEADLDQAVEVTILPTLNPGDVMSYDWTDSDGDLLSFRKGKVTRVYSEKPYDYTAGGDDADWLEAALTKYGPYTRVEK